MQHKNHIYIYIYIYILALLGPLSIMPLPQAGQSIYKKQRARDV